MRLVLAYRKVSYSSDPKYLHAVKEQLLFCKERFPIITNAAIPSLQTQGYTTFPKELSVTFDHASADFYFHIFPFLKQHQIPATVGVAWRYIASIQTAKDNTPYTRSSMSDTLAFQDEIFSSRAPFCSPEELQEIASTPNIHLASHGIGIRNLIRNPPYLLGEVILSKRHLEKLTGKIIPGFIYPFGKYDPIVEQLVRKYYQHSFVLGNTWNTSKKQHLIHRMEMQSIENIETFLSMTTKILCAKNWMKALPLKVGKHLLFKLHTLQKK